MSYPVTDFLIRIKNGYLAGCKTITSPSSKFRESLAAIMKKYGYIDSYSVSEGVKKIITVNLAYTDRTPKVSQIALHSTPGRRLYEKSSSLPWGKTSDALIVISTSAGLMYQNEAVKKKLGGEIIAEIY